MSDQTNDRGQNTGAGSRQHEQQAAGGSFENERQNPGGTDPHQSGASQQGGAPAQQQGHERLGEHAARTAQPGEGQAGGEQTGYGSGQGGIGDQQEQQSGDPQQGAGSAGPSTSGRTASAR